MVREGGLILLLTAVHALGLGLLCGMLWLSFKADDRTSGEDDGDGGWGNDRRPPQDSRGPRDGGLPLPDAKQSPVRLRGPAASATSSGGRSGGRRRNPSGRRSSASYRLTATGALYCVVSW